jgi:cell division protein FtsI (penicillin-binding protein 3)
MSTRRSHRRRVVIAMIALFAIFGIFVIKLVDIQLVRAEELKTESFDKRSQENLIYGQRGDIIDANGVVLAHTVRRYDVTASPKNVGPFERETATGEKTISVEQATAEIGAITGQTSDAVLAIVTNALAENPASDWVRIAQGLDANAFEAIEALDIPWQYWEIRDGRVYPNGSIAGNVIGFSNSDGQPIEGIELSHDACLAAENGSETYEVGADWTRIPGSTITTKGAKNGGQVALTLDADLQWFTQHTLAEQVKAVGGTSGYVTVMETKTGKIRALAQYPSVDPNNVDATPEQYRSARAFTAPFEPGSTLKALTAAALLNEGVAEPSSRVLANYRYIAPNGADINDSDPHGAEQYTLTGVLTDSSNTGISQLGEKLSEEKRYEYFTKFGVGTETEVHFNGESSGILNDLPWDNQTTYATMFGQGLATSAVQVASIYQTLGNNGVRMPVQLVEGCKQADGSLTNAPPSQGTQVVSADAAHSTINMLENVVTSGWLSKQLQIPGYRVAAKTGTAQQADGNGGYSHSYLVSLSGVAPAENPEYVVSVNIADPVTLTSSAAAAPVFQKVMTQVLKAYRVKPSTDPAPNFPNHY